MLKLLVAVVLLLIIETWGIYGAWRTMGIRYTCTTKVGPLCYAWQATAIGKLLGDDAAKKAEDALHTAKESLEKDVIEKLKSGGKEGLDKVLDGMKDMAEDGVDNAKRLLEEKLK